MIDVPNVVELDFDSEPVLQTSKSGVVDTNNGLYVDSKPTHSSGLVHDIRVMHKLHPDQVARPYRFYVYAAALDVLSNHPDVYEGTQQFEEPTLPDENYETVICDFNVTLFPGSDIDVALRAIAQACSDVVPMIVGFDKRDVI